VTDQPGVACIVERKAKIKACKGTLVALVHYAEDNETPLKFVTGIIGEGGLLPDIWYCLDETGAFKACE